MSEFTEICKANGVDPITARARINHGWSYERATTTPPRKYKGTITDPFGGTYNTVAEMCEHFGISKETYFYRVSKKWNLRDILTTPEPVYKDHLGNVFKTQKDRASAYGVNPTVVKNRLKNGVDIQNALKKTIHQTYMIGDKEYKNVREVAKEFNISRTTVSKILRETSDANDRLRKIKEVLNSPCYLRCKAKYEVLGIKFESEK